MRELRIFGGFRPKTRNLSQALAVLSALLCLVTVTASQAAPKYIQFQALSNKVRTAAGNVSESSRVQVPIITWGGDIATIHGNGDARRSSDSSLFAGEGLNLELVREDAFARQLENYISGKSPYLRGTLGMIASASELLNKDPRTRPLFIYQLTWSSGGDALVVKDSIRTAKDLKGKTIALQAYGPHVDYANRILLDAGLSFKDVKIKWLEDLTGTDNSPMAALYEKDIDAAFVIIPDALALTSGGNVGTGSEDSVRGAKILLSTKTANRVIADVYAVRSDYYKANKSKVEAFVQALMKSQESLKKLVSERNSKQKQYTKTFRAAAEILLDSPQALADTEGLYADAELVNYADNVRFFSDRNYPRNIQRVYAEIHTGLKSIGAISEAGAPQLADLDYQSLRAGLSNTSSKKVERFNQAEVASLVTRKQQQNALGEGELFSFDVFFSPNQNSFSADLYAADFSRVVDLASTYGGAIITVEGHSDVMAYLRSKKSASAPVVLGRIKQSAKNLSLTRSQSVRDAIIAYAQSKSVSLDSSQFAMVGHGITQPNTGMCGEDPCAPKTEKEWRSNMRVQFRIIQVEAESSVFQPL